MARCNRCDWQHLEPPSEHGSPHSQAAEHAADTGHPLCTVCTRRSLHNHETQTCARCVARIRVELAAIPAMHTRLADVITGWPADTRPNRSHGGDDSPLPGGRALVLLGRGGDAIETGETARDGDSQSVIQTLATIEDDWRNLLRHPAADLASVPAAVPATVAYLMRQLDRAAQTHPAFYEPAGEIHRLHIDLENALGETNHALRAPARCFDCGDVLERHYLEPRRCRHEPPTFGLIGVKTADGWRRETRSERDWRVKKWAADHLQCNQGGLEDRWQCRGCERTYENGEYFLALRQSLEEAS